MNGLEDLKVDEDRPIALSKADTEMLIALLDKPPLPNEALRRAFERFKLAVVDKVVS